MTQSAHAAMLAGAPYKGNDPALVAMRDKAKGLLRRLDRVEPEDLAGRRAVIQALFGSVGREPTICPGFACDYGTHISVGDDLFVNFNCVFLDCAPIVIGNAVQIAPCVQLYTAEHPLDPDARRAGWETARPIHIGDNVWIGGGAIVLPGVTIGDDAIIGAGSVVTRDVAAGSVVVGNPARSVRRDQAARMA